MTSSPFLTENGARSPMSSRRPSPTDKTFPRLGFSLAVSGRTIPDLVLDSASRRFTRILSPRGRSFGMTLTPMKERTQNLGTQNAKLKRINSRPASDSHETAAAAAPAHPAAD